jgi:hypothetical protein
VVEGEGMSTQISKDAVYVKYGFMGEQDFDDAITIIGNWLAANAKDRIPCIGGPLDGKEAVFKRGKYPKRFFAPIAGSIESEPKDITQPPLNICEYILLNSAYFDSSTDRYKYERHLANACKRAESIEPCQP